ncbi:hypothetical protein EC968_003148 [Mortierella alpina]|nr:hypothetical protein EC968_003148 [Mortierella alpina]
MYSGTGTTLEKTKLVTPKISKYRVDCNTSKVIKRAKNKKPKASKLVSTSTGKENPAAVAATAPKRSTPTVLSSKNTPTAIPPRASGPKPSLSSPGRAVAPGATWDALAALLKVNPVDNAPVQGTGTVNAKANDCKAVVPPGLDINMAGSPPVRRRPSLVPPKIARSVYRTILDWSVHPTVQPNDFNTTVEYRSTPLSAPSRLRATSAIASSTLGSSSRLEPATMKADGHSDFTAKGTRSRRRIGFESLDAEIEKSSSSTSNRGNSGNNRGQEHSHALPRVQLNDDRGSLGYEKREGRAQSGTDIAATAYIFTPPASPSPSPSLTPLPSSAVTMTPHSQSTGTAAPAKLSTTTIPIVENHDYLYSPNIVLPALSSTQRKTFTLYHAAGSMSLRDQRSVDACIEAAHKAKVKVVELNRRQLDALTGTRHHQGVVLEASRLRKKTIKTLGPVSENGAYELQLKKNHKLIEGEQPQLKLTATTKGSPPLWIAMDEVTDPIVMGEIVRSASYFGVDGLVVRSKNSAPLSPAVSEASVGALETRPVYSVDSLVRFIQVSKE